MEKYSVELISGCVHGLYSQLHAICEFQIVHMFGEPNHGHDLLHLHAIRDNGISLPIQNDILFYTWYDFLDDIPFTKHNATASKMLFA